MWRSLCLGLGVLAFLSVTSGCAKRVPIETADLSARLAVVVTFHDGSQIKGKIGTDERVEITTDGAVYRSTIWDLTDSEIVLRDSRFIREAGEYSAERARMAHARYDLGAEPLSFTFRKDEIERVEEIRVDALRTASQAFFWTIAGTVTAFLLGEKS